MSASVRLAVAAFRRGDRSSMVMMFIVVALAATGVSAGLSVAASSSARLDSTFAAAAGPDMVVTTGPAREHALLDALGDDADVVQIGRPRQAVTTDMATDSDRRLEHLLSVPPADGQRLGAPVIRSGRAPSTADEIVLDAGVAIDLNIAVGDRVSFGRLGHAAGDTSSSPEVEFVVVGTGYDFADCFHPSCDPARSWLTSGGLGRVGGSPMSIIDVALTSRDAAPIVEQRLIERVGDAGVGVNTWIDTRGDLLTELQFFAGFLGVFGVFVLATSAVVIAAAISARTVARRRSIGLSKAVGCTPLQLTGAIVIEHIGVALLAAASGWGLAMLLVPHLRTGPLAVIGTDGSHADVGVLLITSIVVTTIVLLATVGPATRSARLATVAALQGGSHRRGRRGGRGGRWTHRLPWSVELGARRWRSRPMRTAAAAAALMLTLTAGVVSLSIDHSMDHLLSHPASTGDPWDVALMPSPAADRNTVERQLDAATSVGSWYSIIDGRANVDGERVHVRLLGGDPSAARYDMGNGRGVHGDGEAIVGYGLFRERGWRVGQTIELTVDGRDRQYVVVGWYRETEDGGHIIQIREPSSDSIDSTRTYALSAAPGVSSGSLAAAVRPLGGRVVINESDGGNLRPFRVAMAIMATLIAAVTLAHLFATSLASARIRGRDDAALTAVGVSRRETAVATATSTLLTIALALSIGLPIAWVLQGRIDDAITGAIGAGPGVSPAPPVGAIAALAATLTALALLTEIAATRRARSTPTVRVD